MGNSFVYPTGPDDVKNPFITSPGHPILIVLYLFWGLSIIVFLTFFIKRYYKTIENIGNRQSFARSKQRSKSVSRSYSNESHSFSIKSNTRGLEKSLLGAEDYYHSHSDFSENDLIQIPYQDDKFGSFCQSLGSLISFLWIVLYLILIIDYYWSCQLKSVDSLCYYGSYPIFGSYDTNATYFFILWCVSSLWFTVGLIFKEQLAGWFMIPCTMEDATHMYIWCKDKLDEATAMAEQEQAQALAIVQIVQRLRNYITPQRLREGHEKFVAVQTTEDNRPYFIFEATRYIYNEVAGRYVVPENTVIGKTYSDFHSHRKGLNNDLVNSYVSLFGKNRIPFNRRTIREIVIDEITTYFYLYQFVMYVVWFWSSYLFVAVVEFSVVVVGAVASTYIQATNEATIAVLTEYETTVTVRRNGVTETMSSDLLVPGDVVLITATNWVLPCDMILLTGSCVLNESGLTGESMPVQKIACPDEAIEYDSEHAGARHTIFAGTTVLELDGEVEAIVIYTGVDTSKGQLVAMILFPEKVSFRYEQELEVVIFFLLIYGIVLFGVSLYLLQRNGSSSFWVTSWVYGIFTTSQIFSPLLPVALKVGQIRSSARLLEKQIFCLSPRHIAITGKVTVFCFDKTGTLTLEGMDFAGVLPVMKTSSGQGSSQRSGVAFGSLQQSCTDMPKDIVSCMATCHAVAQFGETGQLVGNEVEVKMFAATSWKLKKDTLTGQDIVVEDTSKSFSNGKTYPDSARILRKYEFDHGRQTMSVIYCQEKDKQNTFNDKNHPPAGRVIKCVCKGSFEKIALLCDSNTIPADYHEMSQHYALNGGYVLGLCQKYLDVSAEDVERLGRDAVEVFETFEFLGLMIFRNEPKLASKGAILQLREGAVRPVMITGDNAQCGQYISRQCGLVDQNNHIILAETDKHSNQVVWKILGNIGGSTADENNYFFPIKKSYTTNEILNLIGSCPLEKCPELAVTGNNTLNSLEGSGELWKLLLFIRIFARMSPESKTSIVRLFRSKQHIVGMCGDGGNDCGALRAAHVGIALSEAEASVVSPFTSRTKSPESVVDLLKEGRASLATSFANYKFLVMYGLLFSVVKLVSFYFGVIMSAVGYYCIDGVAIITLCYTMTLSGPTETLRKIRPTSSLLGPISMASSLGVFAIAFVCLLICLISMINHPDYVAWPSEYTEAADWWTLSDNWEATILYMVMFMFILGSAGIYSNGYEFRVPLIYNFHLLVNLSILFAVTSLTFLMDYNSFTNLWHFASYPFNKEGTTSAVWEAYQADGNDPSPKMPLSFRFEIYIVIVVCLVLAALWQSIVLEGSVGDYVRRKYPSNKRPPYRF